jgi:predicted RNase H-like nuclease (RuvC/YqgF family)
MKITAIRIRVLRSRSTGYGHDAAEIEAQIEDGDDPDTVAAELRRRCETEVRQGAEHSRMIDTLDDLRRDLINYEREVARLKSDCDRARKAIKECEGLAELAAERGIPLTPEAERLALPF